MINVSFDVPKEMLRLAQSEDISEKPYNLCLICPFMSKTCDGPDILAMEYPRWVEWANERAKAQGLTHAKISELSGVPKGTVDSVLSGRSYDIRTATMRDITRVLVGGCWGKYPCHFAALLMNGACSEESEGTKELRELLREKDAVIQELREKLETSKYDRDSFQAKIEADAQKKIDYLKAEVHDAREVIKLKERQLGVRSAIISVLATALILLLGFDFFNPGWGLFR